MVPPDPRLRDYHPDGSFWTAVAFVPFWRGELPVWFHTYDKEPTPRQVRIARAVLDYTHDLRGVVERGVFDYYQEHVFGAIDFGDPEVEQECAPRLAEPGEIWRLIPGAEIWISQFCKQGHEDAVEFTLTFECSWDQEHGLGVKFRDWRIVRFGGAAS
jgi:uncharacterized protein DUF6985